MPEITSYPTGKPCWADVTVPDVDAGARFYTDLFGWIAEKAPEPEAGGHTMFRKNGKAVAAASPPMPGTEGVPPHWTVYLASDDADATAAKIRDAGGRVLMDPFDVMDAGRMAVAVDPADSLSGPAGQALRAARTAFPRRAVEVRETHQPLADVASGRARLGVTTADAFFTVRDDRAMPAAGAEALGAARHAARHRPTDPAELAYGLVHAALNYTTIGRVVMAEELRYRLANDREYHLPRSRRDGPRH